MPKTLNTSSIANELKGASSFFAREKKVEEEEPQTSAPLSVPKEKSPTQTSVQLFEDQLDWLDEKRMEARKKGGKRLTKTELIRSLIDFGRELHVDFSGVTTESEVLERLRKARK